MKSKTRRYSTWKAPLLAFFSKAFYADVAYNWNGTDAPVHSWAIHHPFAVLSMILASGYLVLAGFALKEHSAAG